MKVTDAFLGEHGVFYAQFDHLERILPGEDRVETVRGMAALLAAALVPHAELENELLFDAMALSGEHPGPPAMMREEHAEIERLLEEAGEASDLDRAKAALGEAIRLSRIHFEKEERIAFPLAERVLDERALGERASDWAGRRSVRVAPAV